jgi:membrane-bound serine protease (ClpP class)
MMNVRLMVAMVTTLIWEALLITLCVWGLPFIGINIPLLVTIVMALALGIWSVTTYRLGSRALGRKTAAGQPDMAGTTGVTLERLDPEGMVRIAGELWQCRATEGHIEAGEAVTVVAQEKLKLVVRRIG